MQPNNGGSEGVSHSKIRCISYNILACKHFKSIYSILIKVCMCLWRTLITLSFADS